MSVNLRFVVVCASLTLSSAPDARSQESAALFDGPLVVSDNPRLRLLLDLDGDGFDDALSWAWTDANAEPLRLGGWMNDGTGRLQPTWELLLHQEWSTSATVRMQAGHFDQDGREDFAVLVNGTLDGTVFFFSSRGAETPVPLEGLYDWHAFTAPIAGALLHDWSGDGVLERAVLTTAGWLRTWTVTQSSALVCSSVQLGAGWSDLLLVEGTGDELPDLLAVRAGELRLIEMQGCQLGQQTSWPIAMSGAPMPTVGDIDGDGDLDVVVFDMQGYVVLRRIGRFGWELEPYRTGGIGTHLIDIDGDGDLDAVCCGGGGGGPAQWVNDVLSTFRVSLNDGTGVFAPAIEIPGLGADFLAGASDLDHDGDIDLVAGRCVYYAPAPITAEPRPSLGGGPQRERAAADFDGDGDLDFEVGLLQVLKNRGDGLLTQGTRWVPAAPEGMEFRGPGFPGDFDGDGEQDLVVSMHELAGGAHVSMRLLCGAGGGRLVDGGPASAPGVDFNTDPVLLNRPEASVAVDLDGDGDLDLVTRTVAGSSPTSKTWLNLGGGYFARGATYTALYFVTAADFDGDSIPDALFIDSKPRIHWGVGDGSFPAGGSPSIETPMRWAIDRFAVGDLDGDGDLDIAAIARGSTSAGGVLRWARNEGGRVFTTFDLPGQYDGDTSLPKAVHAADLDGDGRLDLVAGPVYRARSALAIHLSDPQGGGWLPPRLQVVWDNDGTPLVHPGFLADVDGDGDPDLVTDRLIRGRRHEGPSGGSHREVGRVLAPAGVLPPTFGGKGPFRPGESAELRLRGAPPGVLGVFTAGYVVPTFGVAPLFDAPTASVEPFLITHRFDFQTSGVAGGPEGSGSWTLAYDVPAYKAGRAYRYMVELFDPSGANGYQRPNRLAVQYGH